MGADPKGRRSAHRPVDGPGTEVTMLCHRPEGDVLVITVEEDPGVGGRAGPARTSLNSSVPTGLHPCFSSSAAR